MACALAMLSACATSPTRPASSGAATDPVVEQRTVTRIVCPPDLAGPGPKPAPPAGAVVRGNEAGLGYFAALSAHDDAQAKAIADAIAVCARPASKEAGQ